MQNNQQNMGQAIPLEEELAYITERIKYAKELKDFLTRHKRFVLDLHGIVQGSVFEPNKAVFREGQRSVIDFVLRTPSDISILLEKQKEVQEALTKGDQKLDIVGGDNVAKQQF